MDKCGYIDSIIIIRALLSILSSVFRSLAQPHEETIPRKAIWVSFVIFELLSTRSIAAICFQNLIIFLLTQIPKEGWKFGISVSQQNQNLGRWLISMSRLYLRRIWIGTQNGLCIPVFGQPIFSFSSSLGFSSSLYLAALLAWLGPSSIYLISLYVHPYFFVFSVFFDLGFYCLPVISSFCVRLLLTCAIHLFGYSAAWFWCFCIVLCCFSLLQFNLFVDAGRDCIWLILSKQNKDSQANCCGFVISVSYLCLLW